jgi:hypothetical protein
MPIRDRTIRNHGEEYVILMDSHNTLGDAMARLRESNYPENDTFLVVPEPDGKYRVILFSELLGILGETWSDEQDQPLSHLEIPPVDRVVPRDTPEGGKSILDWVDTHPGSTLVVIDDQGFVCLFANANRSITVGTEVGGVRDRPTVDEQHVDIAAGDGVAKGIRIGGDIVGRAGPGRSRPQYGEQMRRLDAAMPRESYVGRTTEVRILIALPDSEGLRAHLPDYTEEGDLIEKDDAIGEPVSLSFDKNIPVSVYLRVEAAKRDFEVERPERAIRVYPDRDSIVERVYLTPLRTNKHGSVTVYAYEDPKREISLGSVMLATEVSALEGELLELPQASQQSWRLMSAQGLGVRPILVLGDYVHGNKAVGDQITTGNISDSTGIAVGRGAQAYVEQSISSADLDKLFAPLIAILRDAPPEKRDQASQKAEALKAEVGKGNKADDSRMAKLLDGLAELVPGAVSAVVSVFASPILGGIAGPVTKFVLDEIQRK